MSEAYDPNKPNPFSEANPYRTGVVPEVAAQRPGWLTAIAIVVVVIGVLGLLACGTKFLNLAFGRQMQQMFAGIGAPNEQMRKAQEEMNAAIMGVADRFFVPNVILATSQFFLSIALIFGGIKSLKLDALGRKVLLIALALLLFYEIGNLVTQILTQLGMMPIMQLYMPRMMTVPGQENAGAQRFGTAIAKFSMVAGIVMQSGWTLVKMVFYGFAIYFLRKPNVVSLFAKPAVAKPIDAV